MKNGYIIVCLCLIAWLGSCQEDPMEKRMNTEDKLQASAEGIVPGVVDVKFKPGTDVKAIEAGLKIQGKSATRTGISAMDVLNGRFRVKQMNRIFRYSPKFEKRHEKYGLHLWYRIQFDTTLDTRAVADDYLDIAAVDIVSPVYAIQLWDNHKVIPEGDDPLPAVMSAAGNLPFNDPRLGKQWHYDRGELTMPLEEANIGLFPAWHVCAGDPDVIVAVIDGGIDYTHEDLAANMWKNPDESVGRAGVDDDGNGYIDDVYGYDFVRKQGELEAMDHGTHVAGTVAAVNHNGIGVCGIAGGSGKEDGVRIMNCQIFGPGDGSTNRSREAEAFVYAADMGAVIAQNSWSFQLAGYAAPVVEDAINYFIREAGNPVDHPNSPMRGGIVVFAAGNDGATGKNYYPGAYSQVIAVTATDYRNERASLSKMEHQNDVYYANVGGWVDIAAPGGMTEYLYGVLSTLPGDRYGYMCGTSMASPHVAGVAALIVSRHKGPDFTNVKLKDILLSSVLDISEYEPRYARKMGAGLVRADRAIVKDDGVAPDRVNDLEVLPVSATDCRLKWSVTPDRGDGSPVLYHIYYSPSVITGQNYVSAQDITVVLNNEKAGDICTYEIDRLEAGTWYFAVVGEDAWGNRSECSNVVSVRLAGAGEVLVYPTVVSDVINVTVGGASGSYIKVRLYDTSGNCVLQRRVEHTNDVQLKVGGLSTGIYVLKLESPGISESYRITKR